MPSNAGMTWRAFARYGALACLGGAVIGFAMSRFHWRWQMVLMGAIIGFTCYAVSIGAEVLFHDWLEKKPWRRAIVYFVASQIGWPLGLYLGMIIVFQKFQVLRFERSILTIVLSLGALGTLAGLGVFGYERLKDRLRDSIEQLKEKEFAEKELELARELQARMLPAPDIRADGYRITGRNFAARFVAGDFFDVFQYGDGSVGIAVADVAGKGLAASLIMASVKAVLPLLAMARSVDEAMNALNLKLAGELTKREFVALVLARFDPATGTVGLVNAGLPDPYIVRRDGSVEIIEGVGPRLPLGLRRNISYEKKAVHLAPGDSLLLLSDGLPEAIAPDGEQLGYERLAQIINSAGADVDGILAQVHAATSADAHDDDQTLVVIERTASDGAMSSIPRLEIASRSAGSQSARVSESQS
jgi:MFS family permease